MFDKLIESKSNEKENRKRGKFLLTTTFLVAGLCFSSVVWSLFAKDFAVGNDEFELSTLVAPIQPAETVPEENIRPQKAEKTPTRDLPTRQSNMQQIIENPLVPDRVSVTPNTQRARPNGYFEISKGAESDSGKASASNIGRETGGNNGTGISQNSQPATVEKVEKIENKLPAPPPLKKEPEEIKKPAITTGGVVNGKAKYLPVPVYPTAAKAVGASGNVNVQVLIDEEGNVVSAKAVSGHILLRDTAERAARNAKFIPTTLSKQPVKVNGVIVYNFTRN